MTSEIDSFNQLMLRAHEGDLTAIEQLVQQYEPEIRLVARIKLGGPLRPYLDTVDLVQSVHRSLMIGLRNDRFDISSPEKLVALAMTIVRRKIARQWRKVRRQRRLSADHPGDQESIPHVLAALVGRDGTPDQQAALADQLDALYRRLDDTERQLVQLRFEGHTTAEAARLFGMDPDVLRVKLSRLRQRIKDLGLLTDWI
jgi:RNA polymerase sigma-70 factor (ECF subfamily)